MIIEEREDEEPGRPAGRVQAILRILGRELNPEEVTTDLGLTPTKAFRRGDPFTAGGRRVHRGYGAWTLDTEQRVQTEDLVEHLEHLLELLLPLREQLEKYLSREDVDVAVAVWWEPSDGPVGFTVPARLLHGLAELCDEFDFYFA